MLFAGVATWFATADTDYRFAFSETRENSPRYATVEHYELLPDE